MLLTMDSRDTSVDSPNHMINDQSRNINADYPNPYQTAESPFSSVIKKIVVVLVILIVVTFTLYELLVFLYDDTDPDFENFYYVKVSNPNQDHFQLVVPIPEPSRIKNNLGG